MQDGVWRAQRNAGNTGGRERQRALARARESERQREERAREREEGERARARASESERENTFGTMSMSEGLGCDTGCDTERGPVTDVATCVGECSKQ